MIPARVHVDFNDIEADGTVTARVVEDADAALLPHDPVELYDGDGNTMRGTVRELRFVPPRVPLAVIDLEPGSWKAGEA